MFTLSASKFVLRISFIVLLFVGPLLAQNANSHLNTNTASASLRIHANIRQFTLSTSPAAPRVATSSSIDYNLPVETKTEVREEIRPLAVDPRTSAFRSALLKTSIFITE